MHDLLHEAYQRSLAYQDTLHTRSVFPSPEILSQLNAFDERNQQWIVSRCHVHPIQNHVGHAVMIHGWRKKKPARSTPASEEIET